MSVSYSWTADLIDQVLQQPTLIDPSHHDYRNMFKRDKIWESIGDNLDTSAEEVKKRWRSLRDTYGRYVRRQRQSSGPSKLKKWVWADKMKPLRVHLTTSGDGDYSVPSPDNDADYCMDAMNEAAANEENKARASPESPAYDPIVPEVMLATTSSPTSGTKRKFAETAPTTGHWNHVDDSRPSRADPIDLLFLAYAGTLKTFSGKRQAVTKLKIAEIIMQQELEHQEEVGEN